MASSQVDTALAQPLLDEDTSVRRALALALAQGGVDCVFVLAGGHTGAVIDALGAQDGVRVVGVREESLAGIMAQVYGRLTGRPGVAIGQGAFMLNAASGILEAHLSGTPLLVITDTSVDARFAHLGAYQSGSGEYGSWDAVAAYRAISTSTFVARGGSQTVQAGQLALKHALTRPGCSTLLINHDALRGRVGRQSLPALFATGGHLPDVGPAADHAAISRAAALLVTAQRPVIVAGGGVVAARGYEELRTVAGLLAAAVVTTAGGKSSFAEDHALSLGPMGAFGTTAANAAVAAADVVLVLGSRLSPSDTANQNPALLDPARQAIIQLDRDRQHVAWTRPVAVALLGEMVPTLRDLGRAISAAGLPDADLAGRTTAIAVQREAHPPYWPVPDPEEDRILPQVVARTLEDALPEDAIVCCDAGENRIFMMHYFRSRGEGSFVQAAGVGAMGYAIPAALAAKVAFPSRTAVAICGDGGFGMTLNGLMTAVEEDLPIVVVVMNNRSLGWARHGGIGPNEFADFNLAQIATAMDCVGIRVDYEEQLGPAIREACAAGRAAVVDVRVSRLASFVDIESPLAAI